MSPKSSLSKSYSLAGRLLMVVGSVFAAAIFVDHWTELAVDWPTAWYASRSFHPILCAMCFAGGWWLQSHAERSALHNVAGPVFSSVVVYSRDQCELCQQALATIADYARWLPDIQIVDITSDANLTARHGQSIPVVVMDGEVRFKGTVSAQQLETLILNQAISGTEISVR